VNTVRKLSREGWEGSEGPEVGGIGASRPLNPSRDNGLSGEERFALGTVGDACDSVFKMDLIEIDQEAERERDEAKIVVGDFFEEVW
jgi:hypothetical protein